jgi:hypothetical protein
MNDNAMGLYPIDKRNRVKLQGCQFLKMCDCTQFPATVFIFLDTYRRLRIDLVFTSFGELFISDYYGDSMERENIQYVILR